MSLLPPKRFLNPRQQARHAADCKAYLAFGAALAALLGASVLGALIGCLIQKL